jgi:hypothetical protein
MRGASWVTKKCPNADALATRVSELRAALKNGELEGFTVVAYGMDYRWRSATDVHSGIVVFGRYLDETDSATLRIKSMPDPYPDANDDEAFVVERLRDAYLLEDALALRLAVTGRRDLVGSVGGRMVVLDLK